MVDSDYSPHSHKTLRISIGTIITNPLKAKGRFLSQQDKQDMKKYVINLF